MAPDGELIILHAACRVFHDQEGAFPIVQSNVPVERMMVSISIMQDEKLAHGLFWLGKWTYE